MYSCAEFNDLGPDSELYNKNVYFIEPYEEGISLFVDTNDSVTIKLLNWDATPREINDSLMLESIKINDIILSHSNSIGIKKYQLFFDSELRIVDMIVNGDFVSAGMLISLFGNKFSLQKILANGVLNAESLQNMVDNFKKFYIKPMSKLCNNKLGLCYARVL